MPDSSSALLLPDQAVAPEEQAALPSSAKGGPKTRVAFQYLITLAVCLTVFAVIIPFNPLMPSRLLETPWMMSMNQGVAQGLEFGRDIVFTYGPYASVYTELYHPATDKLMLFGCLLLGASYAFALLLLGRGPRVYWLLLYAAFLCSLLDSRDALLFSYPFLLLLAVYRSTLPRGHSFRLDLRENAKRSFVLLFATLGLLPLVKGSLLPLCGFVACSVFAVLWLRKERMLAVSAVIVPPISCLLLWRLSGQPLAALPGFFWTMREIISGYTGAMSLVGDPWQWILYLGASVLILLTIARASIGRRDSKWFLVVSYAAFLFVAFKACYVRHDMWHDPIAGSSILAAALLLGFVLEGRRFLVPLAASVLVYAYIGHGPVKTTGDAISQNVKKSLGGAVQGIWTRSGGGESLPAQYADHLSSLRIEFPLPLMDGTTDIYSFNQSWLFASGNIWAPRPVIQSYSAYTPGLAERNLRHLEGAAAPDNIVFRVEAIDRRLPSLEDGLSWPALINGYSLQKLDGQTAYLRKRTQGSPRDPETEGQTSEARHQLGELVPLPESREPMFARVEIKPTLLGRALSLLYKPPELNMVIHLQNGSASRFRVVASMMETDFLITPLVASTEDFALLAAGGDKYLPGNEVKTIILSADDRQKLFWSPNYSLSLRAAHLSESALAENSRLFDRLEGAAPTSLSAPSSATCEGAIEAINGTPPRFGAPAIDNVLLVRGWMVVSGQSGKVPEHVFVTLTNDAGKTLYAQADAVRRNDIRTHFNHPEMPDPGYSARLNVSALAGTFKLGLARVYQGNLETCTQFHIPISIRH